MKIQYIIYTCDRTQNYLKDTVGYLRNSKIEKLIISQGSSTYDNIKEIPKKLPFDIEISEIDYELIQDSNVRVKAQVNYMNALTVKAECDYRLILEDDVRSCHDLESYLNLCIEKVKEIEGDKPFFLTLYSPYTNRLKDFGTRVVSKVNLDNFFGLQACLVSESICQDFAKFIQDFNYKEPHDFIIKHFCKERGINIWCSNLSLFQHIGVKTTGLGHHHTVKNFVDYFTGDTPKK